MGRNTALDCTPPGLDLLLYAGDDTRVKLAFLGADGGPLDVGGTLTCEVRRKPWATAPVVCTPLLTITDAAAGSLEVTFTVAHSQALARDGGRHHWDLQQLKDGFITTLVAGAVKTVLDVTAASVPALADA